MHLEDDLAHGMSQEEAEEVARRTSSEHMATMFELSGRIGVRQLPKEIGHALGRKEAKVQQYTQLIAHELGHDLLPIYINVSFAETASSMYLSEEQFRSMVGVELKKDPYLLLRYIEEGGKNPETIHQGFQREAKVKRVSRVTILRSKLIENRRNVLEQLGIEQTSYQQYAQKQLEHVDLTLHGRGVTIVHREIGVQIGEMAHNNSRFLKEVSADGYALYAAFLEWLQGRQDSNTNPEQML